MTCIEDGCESPSETRKYCNKHYQRRLKDGSLPSIKHILSEVDTSSRVAVCSLCGPQTEIRPNGDRWRCVAAKRRTLKYGDDKLLSARAAKAAYAELYKIQNGLCAICSQPEPYGRQLALDHCHDTGAIRGLLCTGCNMALGIFRDDVDVLQKAIEYLGKQKGGRP